MQRRSKQQYSHSEYENNISENHGEKRFVTSRDAAEQFYSRQMQQQQQQQQQQQYSHHNKMISKSNSAAQRRSRADPNLLRGQNGETFKSLDAPNTKQMKKSQNLNNNRDQYDNKQYPSTEQKSHNGRPIKGGSHHGEIRHNDKYHCDICRRLNKNRSDEEPARYCWERYYAVSSSTPQTSMA